MKKLLPLLFLMVCSIASQAQTVSFSVITPPCHNDGLLSVTFSALTPPLQVKWYTSGTTGSVILHTGVSGSTDVLTSYSGGPIGVFATDTFGVTDTSYFYGAPPFNICSISVFGGTCPAPDTMSASVCGGGTAPFTYQWYNYTTSGLLGTVNPITVAPNNVIGLTVTDAAGCTYGSLVDPYVTAYSYYIQSFYDSVHTTIASCTNGTATAVPYGGGVPPFSYLWSTGAATSNIGSLVTGSYEVTVTDAVGCTAQAFGFVPQSIVIGASVVPSPATCLSSDGSIVAFGSGGMPPYSYRWNNGATTQSQVGLGSGTYDVVVTDANGCIGTGASFVGVSTPVVVTYTTTPSLCTTPNGTATINATGGTGPYSVTWYTYPVQTTTTAIGLTYGSYYFRVTDALGCEQDGNAYVPPVDVISLSFLASPALCTLANGSMTAFPTGGVAPYSYHWSTGTTAPTISGKPSGYYTVTVTDNLGCKVTKTELLPDHSPLGIATVATPSSCIYTNDGIDSAIVWGGAPPYSYAWSSGGTTRTISALPTGPYWVKATDAAGCTTYDYYSYVPYDTLATSCYCTIEGTVYNDTNGNCTQDLGENGIPNIQIHITGGLLSVYTYTDASGHYSYKVPSGTYTVAETVLAYYPLSACQLNNIAVTSTAGSGCINTVNFGNAMDTIHDMHISTWDFLTPYDPIGHAVIGHSYTQAVIVTNQGTVAEDSVSVTYKPDGRILSPTFVPGGYFSGSPYYYTSDTIPTIVPGASQSYLVNYTVPTNIPINTNLLFKDTVVYKGSGSTWTADYSPWNNVNAFNSIVLGSFDPNFKEVSPKGTGPTGIIQYTDSVLEYMVHFQNTGSWQAENITVIDTLDPNLNWTTLQPVFMSSQGKVTVTQSGAKKIARFEFNNINLPPAATDPVRSNGMFTYTIHLTPGLPTGTQIFNKASIYFDYNAPVTTNATINTLGSSSHVSVPTVAPAATASSFTVYPNPANNSFNAVINSEKASSAEMFITDVSGRTLISKTIALQKGSQTIPVAVETLASGSYFVTVEINGKQQTQKLVILKQ